jgi:hypothetical protein
VLAQGGVPEGLAVREAVHAGGRFSDYRKAFAGRSVKTSRAKLFIVRDAPSEGRRHTRWLEPASDPS